MSTTTDQPAGTSLLTMEPGADGRVLLYQAANRDDPHATALYEGEMQDGDTGFIVTVGDESLILYATRDSDGWAVGVGQNEGTRTPRWPISIEPADDDGLPILLITLPTMEEPDVAGLDFSDDDEPDAASTAQTTENATAGH